MATSTRPRVDVPPAPSARSDRRTLVAGCVAIGLAIAVLGLPPNLNGPFVEKLQVSGSELTWVGDADFVGAAASAYLLGSLANRLGRRRVLLAAAALVVVGQAVSAVSGSAGVLGLGQVVAGVGVGGLSAVSLVVVVAAARTPADRAAHVAAFAGSLTLGSVAGAVVGGLLARPSSYAAAFAAMAALGVGCLLVIAATCRESRAEHPRGLDPAGQLTLVLALVALLFAVIQGAAAGWTAWPVVLAFAVAAASAAAFLAVERRGGGMIDLSVFRSAAFSVAAATAVVSFFAFAGSVFPFALRSSVVQGRSAGFTATALVLVGAVGGVAGFASRGLLGRRVGPRAVVVAGMLCFVLADVWLARTPATDRSFAVLLPYLVPLGLAQALTTAGMSAAAVGVVPAELESVAGSTQGVLRQLGNPLGIAVVGAVVFGHAQGLLADALRGLPGDTAGVAEAARLNGEAGVLGVLRSAAGRSSPQVGRAAVDALSRSLDVASWTIAVVCLVMAAAAAVWLRPARRPDR